MPARARPLAERFWPKVDVRGPDECWPWLGARNSGGYGIIRDIDTRLISASRASLIVDGRDPGALWALHSCDNPVCVNPAHLRPGTQAENLLEAVDRGRHTPGTARLTPALVTEIRARARGGAKQQDIAAEFGVAQSTVSEIVTRHSWARAA